MTYLRHAARHVQQTLMDDLEAAMREFSWVDDPPFGTLPLVFQRTRMDESEMKSATGNMVAMSFGDEPDYQAEQLGGGLASVEHVLFVDCLGVNDTIALALANDVKDLLAGEAPGYSRYHAVRDYTSSETGTAVAGWTCELQDVIRERPLADWRRSWQVVKATAVVYFPGAE